MLYILSIFPRGYLSDSFSQSFFFFEKDIKGILIKFIDEIKMGSRTNMVHKKHDSKISIDWGYIPDLAWLHLIGTCAVFPYFKLLSIKGKWHGFTLGNPC